MIKLIPYDLNSLPVEMQDFSVNRGFLGVFPRLARSGNFYGLHDAPDGVTLTLNQGYRGPSIGRDAMLEDILGVIIGARPKTAVWVQDPWSPDHVDYYTEDSVAAPRCVDGGVYLEVRQTSSPEWVSAVLAKMISALSVVIFLEPQEAFRSTSDLIAAAFAVAIEAYDGQGWLLWTKQKIYAPQ